MLGHIVCLEQKGRKPLIERETVEGLGLLRLAVFLPAGAGEGLRRRRINHAARLLHRAGVRRVLTGEDFPHWDILRAWELTGVDSAPLCQALAARLALTALVRKGVSPGEATLALRGNRVSRPFFQAAMELAPAVRALAVTSPNGGEALSAYLRSEYGVPVLEEGLGLHPNLTLEFSLLKGGAGEKLILHGNPVLTGLTLLPPSGAWPPGFAPLPLAAALWEAGALPLHGFVCV